MCIKFNGTQNRTEAVHLIGQNIGFVRTLYIDNIIFSQFSYQTYCYTTSSFFFALVPLIFVGRIYIIYKDDNIYK